MSETNDTGDGVRPVDADPVRRLGANTPIVVTSRVAWVVESGTVELFAQHETGGELGRRHLLTSVAPGGLVWPGPGWVADPGWRVVAVGQPGTTVRALAMSDVEHDRGSDAWQQVYDLAQAVSGVDDDQRPGQDRSDAEPPTLAGAAAAFAASFSHAVETFVTAEGDEARRLAARPAAEHHRLDVALTELASVMEGDVDRGLSADGHTQIGQVLRRVGQHIGLDVPDTPPAGVGRRSIVVEWAHAAGARVRVVSLASDWWKRPGLPMVGYVDAGTRPVALLPGRGRWHLFDPTQPADVRLDSSTAKDLASTAHVLYPTLPRGSVSAWDLVRFALHGRRRDAWQLLGLGLLAGVLALVTPVVVSIVYDVVLPGGYLSELVVAAAFLGLAAVTATLATLSRNLVLVRLAGIAETRIDPAIIDRLLRIDAAGLRESTDLATMSSGDLANRINGLQRIRGAATGSVASAILTLLFSVVSLAFVFIYSVALGLVAVVTLAVTMVMLGLLLRLVLRHTRQSYDVAGRLNGLLLQATQGIAKLRVAGAEPRFIRRWASDYRVQQAETYEGGRATNWITAITGALPALVVIPVYAVAATTLRSSLSSGQFLGVIAALGQFAGAVAVVSVSLSQILLTAPLWARLASVLDVGSEPGGEAAPTPLAGRVELADVSFSYRRGDPPVLRNVSLHAAPGEFVAITGPSGGGKSTLIRLILGLERPMSGAVLIDDRDTRQLDMAQVRRSVGVVPQEGQPLPGTVMDTILGAHPGTESEAWAAASAAGIADDIRAMPMQMHTVVGEGGAAFSGGQVQRLLIARALARRPALVLLDEATSALDDRTQADLSARLDALSMTRIAIAHRLSTIRHADRIYVIDQGTVVESGAFDELVAAEGAFARLARRQLT